MKRLHYIMLLLMILLFLPLTAKAEEISAEEALIKSSGISQPGRLFNGKNYDWQRLGKGAFLSLTREEGLSSLYLIFNEGQGSYKIVDEDQGTEILCGEKGYLHEFIDLKEKFGYCPQNITLYSEDLCPQLGELRAFTEGMIPSDVQQWKNAPEEGVDLLLFPAHGDDEQLFFAGLLPFYAGEMQYEVQVVYSTDHHNYGKDRPHEMLDGLWAVGVRNYPVFGPFPDYLTKTERDAAVLLQQNGFPKEKVYGFVTEQLRRFRPLVAVGHDLEGEYGHGTHRLYGRALKEAVACSMDEKAFPESAEKYGVWDVPKTYLHLYKEEPIHMNWDQPLASFAGMTAYEVTKELGYPAHVSQYSGFAWYFADKERAENIEKLSPCDYGLLRSLVGPDEEKNDFFEHLLCRKEQKRKAEAEAKAEEQRVKLQQEEALKKKEWEKEEKAQKEAQEQQKSELLAEKEAEEMRMICLWLAAGIAAMTALLILLLIQIRK